MHRLVVLFVVVVALAPAAAAAPPPVVCQQVHSPFLDDTRTQRCVLRRITSGFGDGRRSYVRGHKHAGVDLKTTYAEAVYGMCKGTVVDIHLGTPHRTVVVRHVFADGTQWFASYKHVEDVGVKVGDVVDESTRIGRVFTRDEQRRAPWRANHLHFEIRHAIDDDGAASWTSMSLAELKQYAWDPARFLRRHLQPCRKRTSR